MRVPVACALQHAEHLLTLTGGLFSSWQTQQHLFFTLHLLYITSHGKHAVNRQDVNSHMMVLCKTAWNRTLNRLFALSSAVLKRSPRDVSELFSASRCSIAEVPLSLSVCWATTASSCWQWTPAVAVPLICHVWCENSFYIKIYNKNDQWDPHTSLFVGLLKYSYSAPWHYIIYLQLGVIFHFREKYYILYMLILERFSQPFPSAVSRVYLSKVLQSTRGCDVCLMKIYYTHTCTVYIFLHFINQQHKQPHCFFISQYVWLTSVFIPKVQIHFRAFDRQSSHWTTAPSCRRTVARGPEIRQSEWVRLIHCTELLVGCDGMWRVTSNNHINVYYFKTNRDSLPARITVKLIGLVAKRCYSSDRGLSSCRRKLQ